MEISDSVIGFVVFAVFGGLTYKFLEYIFNKKKLGVTNGNN